jgi:hypothetical protein
MGMYGSSGKGRFSGRKGFNVEAYTDEQFKDNAYVN